MFPSYRIGCVQRPVVSRIWQSAVAVSCLYFLCSADSVLAQRYRVETPDIDERQARAMWSGLSSVLNGGSALSDADKKAIRDYFILYKFQAMTNTSAEALAELADEREGLIRDFNRIRSTAARDYVLDVTLSAMRGIATINFHPAVRYNAVLIISQLDQRPAQTGGNAQPPVVLPAATQRLLELVTITEIAKSPSSVKVAALVGLQRHARFGINEQLAQPATDAMLDIINATERPADASKDVFAWMRAQAAGVLVRLHANGVNEAVSAALVKLLADDQLSGDDRCYVASLMTKSMFAAGASGVDFEAYQNALGGLAKEIFAIEEKKADEYNEEVLAEQGGFGGGGRGFGGRRGSFGGRGETDGGGRGRGYGGRGEFGGRGGLGLEEDTGPHYETRRMLDRVMGVLAALDAVAPAAADPVQTHLNELPAPLRELADMAVVRDQLEVRIVDAVINTAEAVNRIVDNWGTSEDTVAAVAPAGSNLVAGE